MNRYYIKDDAVVDLLIKNGFVCRKPDFNQKFDSDAQIQIFLPSQEEHIGWYETDCPIEQDISRSYTFPDKTIIHVFGTALKVVDVLATRYVCSLTDEKT